jgi:phosphotransferase system enzyme I (PtsI)
VVARELTPSLTVELQTEDLRGFVTEHGGATSHAAILARALGIPAVSGIRDVYEMVSCGEELLVDGGTGEVVLWPGARTLAKHRRPKLDSEAEIEAVSPVPGLTVMANISLAHDVHGALRMNAEGIGLYRTEFEFIAAGRVLAEEEQFRRYAYVVKAMRGRPVYVRLLDMGGDKGAKFLDLAPEANPSLGFRGARLLLGRADLLRTQARALARASRFGEIGVIYPMIVDRDQFLRLRKIVEEATRGVRGRRLRHGVMFEVPAACLECRRILEVADFGSIGTNDLVQYLFAVDRNNELVAKDFTADHPVLWSLVEDILRAGRESGKPISLCGEMGGSAASISRLMSIGLRTVSASVPMISPVRRAAKDHIVSSSEKT